MDKIQCLTKVKRVSASSKHHLCQRYGYRCISPNEEKKGLDSFYGPDRSFCLGLMFDDTDFVIEFIGHQQQPQQPQQFEAIAHHSSSFRGRIDADNTRIVAVYFRKTPFDYPKRDFFKHLKTLCQQVPIGTIFYQYSSCDEASIVDLKSIWKKILIS